ncbi:class I SAM-dependent RNA methyltransferase [Nocardia sp. 2]|uniref:Class I SAM-dependent RNA methyltransferase n=1 Tax=Nocardia acididurans TaxID=2802282 RepID=A0ABS1MGA1_9NOCA|nr:class I SAM-dependent RNA methyltransferase [Nocardia acididurans]
MRRIAGWEPEFVVESIPLPAGVAHGVLARTGIRPGNSSPSRIGGVATRLPSLLLSDSQPTGSPGTQANSRSGGTRGPASSPRSVSGTPGRIGAVATNLPGALFAGTSDSGVSGAGVPGVLAADAVAGGWRSRVRLVVDADGRAGVHRYRSTEVIADLRCPQPMAGALEGIAERTWTPGAELVVAVDAEGMRHLVEIAPPAADSADRRSAPGHGRDRRGRGGAAQRGDRRGGDRGSTAARRAAAHSVRAERVVDGSGRAVQYVAGRRWELSATGFWQPHYGAAQCYSDVVAEWSDADSGALTWDLYSGVGVFAARLADQVGAEGAVHAVEFARTAVTEAKANLRDLPWVDSRAERVERWIVEQPSTAPDVVVLDPPRAGAGKEVIAALAERSPRRIVHIGCDPASFARDVSLYQAAGYRPVHLRVFDAFPGTHHVECLAVLER